MLNLPFKITKGLKEEQVEALNMSWRAGTMFRERLVEILTKELEIASEESDKSSALDLPNWEVRQAFLAGQRNATRSFLKLIRESKVDHDL